MEEEHIARLKAEFDVCDSRGCGLLDRNDLTTLCQRLHLPLSHLSLLQDRLLGPPSPLHTEGPPPHREGPSREGQVNFEEFKQGFVEILAKSVDLSISEDDSSYLQPVVPEVSPKFIKGLKRYGRRSRPERPDSEPDSDQNPDHDQDQDHNRSTEGFRGAKLRKATSLESIESLKSDEEPPTQEPPQEEQQGALYTGGVIQVHEGDTQDVLWRLQDQDLQGRVLCSTPLRPALVPSEEHSFHLTSCSLISEGRRLLSVLDNGNGTTSPDRILSLWRDEGLQDCQHVLQVLDFCLDDPVSLSDLTVALDNELMVSSNSVHQAALISYRTELQTLTTLLDESCRQRDKAKFDLDQAELRNLQLLREEEERQNLTETSAQNRIRQVELACKGRVSGLRAQMEQEAESAEREKIALQRTLAELTARESVLQGELCTLRQENVSLEQDLSALRLTLNDSQTYVHKLHQDLHRLLQDKFSLDPSGGAVSPEEHFSEIIKEYELQCRELRDRCDELSSELELVKIKKPERRSKPDQDQNLSWRPQDQGLNRDQGLNQEQTSGYDISEVSSSPRVRRKLTPLDKTALCTLDPGLDPGLNSGPNSGPSVSIQTELALEQLQEKHQEEVHQLTAKMETQVNFYERSLEQMRQNMELERKDIAQAYKMEICELEDQKSSLEIQLKQMKENLEKSQQRQDQQRGHDKRLQRERAEMEQNFAREISNLVQKLSAEKEQVEAELRLKMDQELLLLRSQTEQQLSQSQRRETEQSASWENQLINREEELQHLRKALLQSESSIRQLTVQLSHSEKSLQKVTEQHHQSQQEVEAGQQYISQLEQSLEEACQRGVSLAEQVQNLQEIQTKFQTAINQSEASLQEVSRQLSQSQKEISRLQSLSKSEQSLKQANNYCSQLEEEVKRLQQVINQSQLSLEKCNKQFSQSEEEVRRLQQLLNQSKQSLNWAKNYCSQLEEEMKQLQHVNNQSQQHFNQSEEEVGRLQQLLGQSELSLERAEEYSVQLEEEERAWRVRCSELEMRLEEACAQLKESITFLESHEILNTRLTQEKAELEAELQKIKGQWKRNAEEEVEMLRTDRDKLIQDLKEQAMRVDKLQEELEEERREREEERRERGEEERRESGEEESEREEERGEEKTERREKERLESEMIKDRKPRRGREEEHKWRVRKEEEVGEMKTILERHKMEENKLQQALLQSQSSLLEVRQQFNQSKRILQEVQQHKVKLEHEIKDLKILKDQSETRLQDITTQLSQSEEQIQRLQLLIGQSESYVDQNKGSCSQSEQTENNSSQSETSVQEITEQRSQPEHEETDWCGEGRLSEEVLGEEEEGLREEFFRVSEERDRYMRVCDQLSSQVVEMEEEGGALRALLGEVSARLNHTADLVLDLRRERNLQNVELQRLRDENHENLQNTELKGLRDERNFQNTELWKLRHENAELQRLRRENKENAELKRLREDSELKLSHMEALVRRLEQEDDTTFRTQLEEVRSENSALEERVSLLQQEVAVLEEEVDRKRRKMEEIERDQERMREEQEKLHKENSGLREQMLELSTRNLELSSSNADLSCKTRGDKEALVQVQERLRSLGREQEEHSATVQRLKEELVQSERDKQQRLNSWTQEKHLLQTELSAAKSKVGLVSELEAKLQSLGLKLKWSEDDNGRLRRDAEKRQQQVEQLSASLSSLEIEAESLRAQIQSTNQEALSHKQEVTQAQRRLQEAHNKVEELESSLRKFIAEKEDVTSSFEAELKQLRVANQELESKVQEVQVENQQIHKLHQQEMELRTQLGQLETAKTQAQDQALRADTALSLVQAQHLRQIHQIQTESKSESRTKEELDSALDQLRDERLRRERAEQELRERERGDQQGEYERTVSLLQERTQDLEIQLKATRSLLQEKVQQLQDQVTRAARSGSLVQQLYLENSELQGALQATEQRHRQAQKKSQALESKVQALNRVLRQLVPHALS
ncbi:ninein-like protein [Periophthalmus magnuspinnatus]|uniref:ninein-like protein n=1 Tax=Periophthalmus magnuspinnatus TaxID=409849 RepID=UPI0024368F15|nr:ninein-like protein [Periophthalmus magnuspinnatus]